METNNRSQREKILRNFISGSEFAAIRIFSVVGDQNDIFLCTTATGNLQLIRLGEIGYFRYNSKGRQWEAMLYDGHVLKKESKLTNDIKLSSFFDTNQSIFYFEYKLFGTDKGE